MSHTLLIGTRKGAFMLESDRARRRWTLRGPWFLGHIIHHMVQDPRDPDVILIGAKTGHLGPTVFRSTNRGRSWAEAEKPPAFKRAVRKGKSAKRPAPAVEAVFWLTPGHASEPGVWYAGSSPAGLFRSSDGGRRWAPVDGFNDNAMYPQWAGGDPTPGGQLTHSISVDPRDADHLMLSISIGGTFESEDRGKSWQPLNAGVEADFLPDPEVEFGQDPHCVIRHPADPDRLYQQNHCGIYRLDRPQRRWTRIGRKMPKRIGDIGFPIVGHPQDSDTVWVFPMDGTEVWPRTSPGGKPAVYVTRNGGRNWQRLDQGLPPEQGWFTVLRQAMCCDGRPDRPGLYFGTTAGEVWASSNGGERWRCIARHLPHIFSLCHGV